MSRSTKAHPSTTARDPIGAPRVHLPSEAAQRLNISTSMLRKLTLCGAIGHVRLGVGDQRHRIGYTEAQIVDFIAARTVPAVEVVPTPAPAVPVKTAKRRATRGDPDARAAASRMLDKALAAGSVAEWGRS